MTLGKKAFENIVGKRENTGDQPFLLFTQCFLLYQEHKSLFVTCESTSANGFNSERSKILLFVKGLIYPYQNSILKAFTHSHTTTLWTRPN